MIVRDTDYEYFLSESAQMGAPEDATENAVSIRFTDEGDKANGLKPCTWNGSKNRWEAVNTLTIDLKPSASFGRVRMGRDRHIRELIDKDGETLWKDPS